MNAAAGPADRERPIGVEERSGVLHPQNLRRYDARWFDPAPAVRPVVDQYWHVRWHLPEGDCIEQRIIDLPAITLTIEQGSVPAPLVVTGVHDRAWTRQITGTGSVFAIRLRPAGLAVLCDLPPGRFADATVPVTAQLDSGLHSLLSGIAASTSPEARAGAADAAILERMAERPPRSEDLLANAILDELTSRIRSRTGDALAEGFRVSERTVQRALRATVGRGPKWVSRRIRLQEVVRALTAGGSDTMATLAVELGYADQAHLTRDFRNTAGVAPAAYLRSLQGLIGD